MTRVANDLMRAAIRARSRGPEREEPSVPPVFDTGQPRIDVTDISGTLDLLDEAGS